MPDIFTQFKKLNETFQRHANRLNSGQKAAIKLKIESPDASTKFKECIKLCMKNSERLHNDSIKWLVSEPTRSALFELSLEEAVKAQLLCLFYLKNYELNTYPRNINREFITALKRVPEDFDITIIYSVFNWHDLKVMPINFLVSLIDVLGNSTTSGFTERQRKLIKELSNINFEEIKEHGFYVDLNLFELSITAPSRASKLEVKFMKIIQKLLFMTRSLTRKTKEHTLQ